MKIPGSEALYNHKASADDLLEMERNRALEQAARVCEAMRPHGGRVFTEEQAACFAALSDAAANIRGLKVPVGWQQ